jgi:hypothetical protein
MSSADNRYAMNILNRAGLEDAVVNTVAQRSLVSGENFVVFLDNALNAVRAEFARAKLDEYRQKGWKFILPSWETDATGGSDVHACTVSRRLIVSQNLPPHVIRAINGYELLVYLDATWTTAPEMGFALTFAHELRHVWQYFNAPLVLHSQTPLSWVMLPQLTPCELDAEKASKRVLRQVYGYAGVRAYLDGELAHCKPEHREVIERLATLDETVDPELEGNTIAVLEQHAAEIRRLQKENNFVMPGIPELLETLRGRSDVRLRP